MVHPSALTNSVLKYMVVGFFVWYIGILLFLPKEPKLKKDQSYYFPRGMLVVSATIIALLEYFIFSINGTD